jgi:hypothetical protein
MAELSASTIDDIGNFVTAVPKSTTLRPKGALSRKVHFL